jgi:hypothetical protein
MSAHLSSGHLSSEQWSEWMAGQPSPRAAEHVRQCAACRGEVEQFRNALSELRGAVHAWSAEQAERYRADAASAIPPPVAGPGAWMGRHPLAWALALAALFVIASFLVPRHPADAVRNDAALLNQVDSEVSQSVPSSMEPLLQLVVQK